MQGLYTGTDVTGLEYAAFDVSSIRDNGLKGDGIGQIHTEQRENRLYGLASNELH